MTMLAVFALFPALAVSYHRYESTTYAPNFDWNSDSDPRYNQCLHVDSQPTYDGPACANEYIGLAQGNINDVQSSIDFFTYLNNLPQDVSYNWYSFWHDEQSSISEDPAPCNAIGQIPDSSFTRISCLCNLVYVCWRICEDKIQHLYSQQTDEYLDLDSDLSDWGEPDASSSQCSSVLAELADTYGEEYCKSNEVFQFVERCSTKENTPPPSRAPTMLGQCSNGFSDASYDGTKCANDYLALLEGNMGSCSPDFLAYLDGLSNDGAYNWYTFWEDQRNTVDSADCEAIAAIPERAISSDNCLCQLRSVCDSYCQNTIQAIYIEQSGMFIVNNEASASSSVCNTVLALLADDEVLCQDTEVYQAVVHCSDMYAATTKASSSTSSTTNAQCVLKDSVPGNGLSTTMVITLCICSLFYFY